MTMTISGTSDLSFPDATTQTTAPTGVGIGQTWQTVSRSANTTYTNSTGKPIMVAICHGGNNVILYVNTGGGNIQTGNGGSYSNSYAIVPNGATYYATSAGVSWTELR